MNRRWGRFHAVANRGTRSRSDCGNPTATRARSEHLRDLVAPLILVIALSLAAGCGSPPVDVARFDVAIQVRPEGVAEIDETIALAPDAAADAFMRRVRPERAETVEFVSASIDGAPAPAGAVLVRQDAPDSLEVTWRRDGSGEGGRVLGLRYRATGALAVQGRRGEFVWSALPEDGWSIAAARVEVTVPEGAVRVGQWGIAEAGWEVSELPNGIAAVRQPVGPADRATVLAQLGVNPATMTEPRWQHDEAFGRQLIPAFISGGLFILVIGAGVIWIIRFEAVSRTGRRAGWRQAMPARTAEGLFTAGIVCLAFGLAVLAATYLILRRYGDWSLAIPASILIVGAMFLLLGRRTRTG